MNNYRLSDKQTEYVLSLERQIGVLSEDVRSFKTKNELDEYIELLNKKVKKRKNYISLKKDGKLKAKIWTHKKIIFYVTKLVEKYGQIYTRRTLALKLKFKNIDDHLIQESLDEIFKLGIVSETGFIKRFINRKILLGNGIRKIKLELLKKGISGNDYDLDEYFKGYLEDEQENGLLIIDKLLSKFTFTKDDEKYIMQNDLIKMYKKMISKGYDLNTLKDIIKEKEISIYYMKKG